ncbi:hypothetical protein BDR26DRAFT_949688 [Obelidium mucronatum]|nr:hypothetical protein BDR26DRAFT_949688 [Obelidium mucronatum]
MLAPPSFQAVYASKWLRQATIINWTSRFACPTTHYYYRIPYSSFAELQNLVELKLTRLCGVIPKEIGELGALRTLSLNFNPLLTGPVPKELGNLKRLVVLDLSRCGLVGELPYEIGDLTALETLSVNGNKLEGAIPSSIGNLKNLRKLHLGWNGFSGLIPKEIGALENLETFAIHYNHACGEVPAEFGKLKALCFVNMASNLLSGPGSLPKFGFCRISGCLTYKRILELRAVLT